MTTIPETPPSEARWLPHPSPAFTTALEVAAEEWVAAYGYGSECPSILEGQFLRIAGRAWMTAAVADGRQHPPPPPQGHFLYRLWSPGGRLVYLGVSRCLDARLKAHRRRWDQTVWGRATWEEHPDAEAMFAAERRAIIAEAPPLNIAGVE